MIRSDSGADKLFHEGAAGEDEVLQAERSSDVSPVFSGISLKVLSIDDTDSPYTVVAGDYTIRADATSGSITINLPAATGSGRILRIKRLDGSANTISVAAAGGETIDGAATSGLTDQYSTLSVQDVAAGVWDIVPLAGSGGSSASNKMFEDLFDDASIGWQWLSVARSGTIGEAGSVLTITAPAGTNCDWWSNVANGPAIFIPIFHGPFEVIAKLNSYVEGTNTEAGLGVCIGQAGASANIWGLGHIKTTVSTSLEVIQFGSAAAATAAVATLPIWLRARVSAGSNTTAGTFKVTFGYSTDGVTYTDLYSFVAIAPTHIFLFCRNWLDSGAYRLSAAPFESFTVNHP
jgi:hypothetical protein